MCEPFSYQLGHECQTEEQLGLLQCTMDERCVWEDPFNVDPSSIPNNKVSIPCCMHKDLALDLIMVSVVRQQLQLPFMFIHIGIFPILQFA